MKKIETKKTKLLDVLLILLISFLLWSLILLLAIFSRDDEMFFTILIGPIVGGFSALVIYLIVQSLKSITSFSKRLGFWKVIAVVSLVIFLVFTIVQVLEFRAKYGKQIRRTLSPIKKPYSVLGPGY